MLTIKNGQISLYCHFNKIIKGSGNSFQFPGLSQTHARNVCHYLGFKRKKHNCNFHYVAMSMMRSQILKSVEYHKNTKIYISQEQNIIFSSNEIIH